MRPRATLRCLTRLGINIRCHLLWRSFSNGSFGSCCAALASRLLVLSLSTRTTLPFARRRLLCHSKFVGQNLALVNPNAYADDAVCGLCFGFAVVDVGANRME